MNKKFKTIFAFAVSSLMLFSCANVRGNLGDDNDDLLKKFSLENDSNLESGGSSRFFVSFNDQHLNNEDVTYSIIKSNGDVYLEDDTVYFLNKNDTNFTLKASFSYQNQELSLEKEYSVSTDTTLIKEIKTNAKKGENYFVRGIVTYKKGNSDGLYDGFVLTDGDDSIYVYGSALANSVEIGNKVKIQADFTYYITSTEESHAEKFNFDGGKQLEKGRLIENDVSLDNKISSKVFLESTIYDLANAPIENNITSNLYKVKGKVKKVVEPGFTNYYLYDPKGVGSMYAYSNYNGAEYTWLDAYDDGKYHDATILIVNAKCQPNGCYFRMIPFEIGSEEYIPTDMDKVEGVAIRASESFNKTYYTSENSYELENLTADEQVPDAKIEYFSSDKSIIDVNNNKLVVKNKTGEVEITIKVTLNEIEYSKVDKVVVSKKEDYNITSISDLRSSGKHGETYFVEGVVIDSVWTNASIDFGAYYIMDKNGDTILCYPDSENVSTELNNGEKVIFEGKYEFAQDNPDYYQGNIKLNEVKIKFHDSQVNKLPKDFETKTIDELSALVPSNDKSLVGTVYRSEFTVSMVESTYYTNFYLNSTTNGSSKRLTVYANGKSTETNSVKFLTSYVGKKCTGLIGIRDSKNGKSYRFDILPDSIELAKD